MTKRPEAADLLSTTFPWLPLFLNRPLPANQGGTVAFLGKAPKPEHSHTPAFPTQAAQAPVCFKKAARWEISLYHL